MLSKFSHLIGDKSSSAAIGYGLIAVLLSVAAIGASQNPDISLSGMYATVLTLVDIAVAMVTGGDATP